MLTGRFQLAAPRREAPAKTAVVLAFGPRTGGPPADAAPWTAGRPGCPADDAAPRSATATRPRWARSISLPAGVDAADPGLGDGRAGPRRDDPGADARGVAASGSGATRASSRTLLAQPGVRGRHRQRLQRRDPPRGAAAAVPQALDPRRRGGRRAVPRDASDARRRDRACCASACRRHSRSRSATSWPSTTRAAQPCPRCGTRITEVKRGRLRHVVLPGLPALTRRRLRSGRERRRPGAFAGCLRIWPTLMLAGR